MDSCLWRRMSWLFLLFLVLRASNTLSQGYPPKSQSGQCQQDSTFHATTLSKLLTFHAYNITTGQCSWEFFNSAFQPAYLWLNITATDSSVCSIDGRLQVLDYDVIGYGPSGVINVDLCKGFARFFYRKAVVKYTAGSSYKPVLPYLEIKYMANNLGFLNNCNKSHTVSNDVFSFTLHTIPYIPVTVCNFLFHVSMGSSKVPSMKITLNSTFCRDNSIVVYDGRYQRSATPKHSLCGRYSDYNIMASQRYLLLQIVMRPTTRFEMVTGKIEVSSEPLDYNRSTQNPSTQNEACTGGTKQLYATQSYKTLNFESLPSSEENRYTYCRWKIDADSGRIVEVKVSYMEADHNQDCESFSLSFYETSNPADQIAKACSSKAIGWVVKSKKSSMTIELKMDSESQFDQFTLMFRSIDFDETPAGGGSSSSQPKAATAIIVATCMAALVVVAGVALFGYRVFIQRKRRAAEMRLAMIHSITRGDAANGSAPPNMGNPSASCVPVPPPYSEVVDPNAPVSWINLNSDYVDVDGHGASTVQGHVNQSYQPDDPPPYEYAVCVDYVQPTAPPISNNQSSDGATYDNLQTDQGDKPPEYEEIMMSLPQRS